MKEINIKNIKNIKSTKSPNIRNVNILKTDFTKDEVGKRLYENLSPKYKIIHKLIQKRIEKNLTQKELAKMLNTKQSSIARFESGAVNPTVDFLEKTCSLLGCKLEFELKDL